MKMGQDTYYEISRRSVPSTKNDEVHLSWCDTVINIRTDKGMNFFEFSFNLGCLDRDIDVYELSIPIPKDSPASDLCKSRFINQEMKNYDYTEMLIDSSFWPHNTALTQEMTNVIKSEWSPPYFVNNKSVLAILNNIGGVEIFMQQQFEWKSILNLSPPIKEHLQHKKLPKNFKELKESVYIVETSIFCWAPNLNKDNSCYLVNVQKNGVILFWQISNNIQAQFMNGQIPTGISEIKNIIWIPKTDTEFLLVCGDILGQVNAFQVIIENGVFQLLESHTLWQHKDRMIASNLNHTTIDGNVILFYSKHRHFVVQMLDENYKILSQFVKNVCDYRISVITHSSDGYYLGTMNVKIYKLNINIHGNDLTVDLIPIELKDPYLTYELHSFSFSSNNMLCALGMVDRRLRCRKEIFKVDIIFCTTNSKIDYLVPLLLINPTRKLTNYWDCIECLRYNINKTKIMPVLDYNALYLEASSDIYKLKIYWILLHFFLKMKCIARINSDFTLPELSVDTVKEKILLLHAQSTIKTLYKKYQENTGIKLMEAETFYGCIKYIEFYSKKHKTEIVMDINTLSIVQTDFKYTCQSCDDKVIEGFKCQSGHLNMYCMLSFTPIKNDYFVCRCCNSTARTDLCYNSPLCLFCDQHLIKPD